MPRTLAQIQADIDRLRAEAAQGISRTSFGDRSVEYRPLSDILAMIDNLETEKAAMTSVRRPKQYFGYSTKGF